MRIPSRPPSSNRPWNTSAQACASGRARCVGMVPARKNRAMVARRTLGTSSQATRRASFAVQTGGPGGSGYPSARQAARTNPKSNRALWATNTAPSRNSSRAGSTASMAGAGPTAMSSIPVRCVMNRGMGPPGFTSVCRTASRSPPRYRTAPTSVIAQSRGDPPVVSRSTMQNVTSDSGVSGSSPVARSSSPTVCSTPPPGAAGSARRYRTCVRRSSWDGTRTSEVHARVRAYGWLTCEVPARQLPEGAGSFG